MGLCLLPSVSCGSFSRLGLHVGHRVASLVLGSLSLCDGIDNQLIYLGALVPLASFCDGWLSAAGVALVGVEGCCLCCTCTGWLWLALHEVASSSAHAVLIVACGAWLNFLLFRCLSVLAYAVNR